MNEQIKEMDQAIKAIRDREGEYLAFTLANEEYGINTTERYCSISNLKVMRDYFKAMEVVMMRNTRGHPSIRSERP